MSTIVVVGLGLIGGSAALVSHQKKLFSRVIGVDANPVHARQATELNLVQEIMEISEALPLADMVLLAVPVDSATKVLPQILNRIQSKGVVIDMGSTKFDIINCVQQHKLRGRYVACHPMWGTEFSGPSAATLESFSGKAAIICNQEDSDPDAVAFAETFLKQLGMHLVYMNAVDHDVHTAYISHISHITSFALANTVLEKEKEEDAIFELASAGFESTVRLAKSNASTWVPIFKQNRDNVLDVLNEHISQLRKFKSCLEKENWDYLKELIEQANNIKKILH